MDRVAEEKELIAWVDPFLDWWEVDESPALDVFRKKC